MGKTDHGPDSRRRRTSAFFAFDILTAAFHYGNKVFAKYPADINCHYSPVMQKKTMKWEPFTEKMYVRDGVLKGDINMALLLEGGGNYRCDVKTTYKAKKAVRLPNYHFVDHRIEILSHDGDYSHIKPYEHAEAHSGLPKQTK